MFIDQKDGSEVQTKQRELNFVFGSFLVFIAIYFSMLNKLPLTIDAEYHMAAGKNLSFWVGQGRWGMYLVEQYLWPSPVMVYITLAMFGVASSLSFLLMLKACSIKPSLKHLCAFAIFCGFPIWSTLLEFSNNTPGTSAGLVAVAWAAYSTSNTDRNKNKYFHDILISIGEILALAFAVGCYQSFVFVFICMVIGISIFIEEDRQRILLRGALTTIAGLFTYFLIDECCLHFMHLQTTDIQGYIKLKDLVSHPFGVVRESWESMRKTYTGHHKTYGASMWGTSLVVLFALVMAFSRNAIVGLLLVCTLLAPFPLLFIDGGSMPFRTLIGVPVALAFCALIMVEAHQAHIRTICMAICGFLAVQSAFAVSQYQTERDYVSTFETASATLIYQRIGEVGDLSKPQPVYFSGYLDSPHILGVAYGSTAGGSFFTWDGGNPGRMINFMKLIGLGNNMTYPTSYQERQLENLFTNMPNWPASGSVQMRDGIVLVKLNDKQSPSETP